MYFCPKIYLEVLPGILVDLDSIIMQEYRIKAFLCLEKKSFKKFIIYLHGGNLDQCTMTILAIFYSSNQEGLT